VTELRATRRLLASGLVAAALFAPCLVSPNAAADDPAATALIERGLDLRQAQKDPEALVLFEQAQRIAPSPRGQAQVALVQQALGRWASAERNLRAALAEKDDTWIASRRPILEKAMSVIETHLGDVEIVGAKSGTVYVDGAMLEGRDALTHLRLEVGRRTLELRAAGFYPFSRVLDVRPGEVVRVEVEQHALLEAPKESRVTVAPPATAGSPPGGAQRTIGWVALGGAGLFVATGVAGLVVHDVAASDFNANASCTTVATSGLSSQCRGWLSDGSTGQTLEIVGFVGGGVIAALSVALLLTAPSSKPKATSLSVPCIPTLGGAWCSMQGTF
jgi:hypothetical protein